MFQIPSHYGEAVLEGGCADPDVLHTDRLTFGFECCEQIAGTNGFRTTERKNVDAAQNLAGYSFPQKRTVGNAGCSVSKFRDAYY